MAVRLGMQHPEGSSLESKYISIVELTEVADGVDV